jgi:hypothetical protein
MPRAELVQVDGDGRFAKPLEDPGVVYARPIRPDQSVRHWSSRNQVRRQRQRRRSQQCAGAYARGSREARATECRRIGNEVSEVPAEVEAAA